MEALSSTLGRVGLSLTYGLLVIGGDGGTEGEGEVTAQMRKVRVLR